ncbi:uncharacterized protein [Miscanthus floridulus]|uniref:uncharacterized protein isoform X4 n=1 Tax=Miscanthus floridulus TaxID=154761 RepID=UPI0034591475
MRLEASYAAKELADIHGIIGPVFHKVRPPISLCRFRDEPSIYQGCPACLGGGACPGRGRGPWKQHQHLSLVATHQQQVSVVMENYVHLLLIPPPFCQRQPSEYELHEQTLLVMFVILKPGIGLPDQCCCSRRRKLPSAASWVSCKPVQTRQ